MGALHGTQLVRPRVLAAAIRGNAVGLSEGTESVGTTPRDKNPYGRCWP